MIWAVAIRCNTHPGRFVFYAARPAQENRVRAAWGVTALTRFMRATLNTGRILNPVGVVEDGHRKSQRDRVLTGSGRAIRSLTAYHTQPVRIFNFCRPFEASGGLFHALLNVCQDAERGLSKKFPGLSGVVAHSEQPIEGNGTCPNDCGANPHQDCANGASR